MDYSSIYLSRSSPFRLMCYVLIITLVFCKVDGVDVHGVKRLKAKLFTDAGYDKTIRPVLNQSEPIQVYVGLGLTSVIDFGMSNGKLELTGYVQMQWTDIGLAWNVTSYDGITRLAIGHEDIWMPEIVQINTVGEHFSVKTVFIENTGKIIYILTREFRTFCNLNMRYYPKDEHECEITLFSSKYPSEEVSLFSERDTINLDDFKEHGEWTIKLPKSFKQVVTNNKLNIKTDRMIYTFVMSRMPEFNLLHKAFPLFFIMVANVFVHMVPVLSGERISFSVTLLLAFVFWVAIVAEELPHNSSKLSLLSIMMSLAMCLSTLLVIFSVVLCRLAVVKVRPVPGGLRKLTAWRIRKFRKSGKDKKPKKYVVNSEVEQSQDISLESGVNGGQNKVDSSVDTGDIGGGRQEYSRPQAADSKAEVTWLDVADTLDLIGGFLNVVVVLIVGVVFIIIYQHELEG